MPVAREEGVGRKGTVETPQSERDADPGHLHRQKGSSWRRDVRPRTSNWPGASPTACSRVTCRMETASKPAPAHHSTRKYLPPWLSLLTN